MKREKMASLHGMGHYRAISTEEPTELDHELSRSLDQTICECRFFEDQNGMKKREDVLNFLEETALKWVSQIAEKLGLKQTEDSSAKVLPFGGHLLGTIMKDSDIDVLCIVPNFVNREEFFISFVELLKGEAQDSLSSIRLVKGARVPIIATCLRGLEVDLCISQLAEPHIPRDHDVFQDKVLENMAVVDILSLNGVRESNHILDLVPNVDTFRQTLKAVKLWAKVKGVSSYPLGYPGGIAWAVMVAHVCQLYPNALPATLLAKVFAIYKDWDWPKPVLIAPISKDDPYNLTPWNPKKNHEDTFHIMPVITPVYPQQNCAYCVNHSALTIVKQHMEQAFNVLENINKGQGSWKGLFTRINFFSLHKHYMMLDARAETPQQAVDWCGLVFARSRIFLEELENEQVIDVVHAYPKTYKEECSSKWFWGLRFKESSGVKISLAECLQRFLKHLITLAKKRDIYEPGMRLEVHHVRRKDIPRDLFNEESM